jgi:hypothetical protein
MDHLIVEYKQILQSIDTNIQSLTKMSPKYISSFAKKDAENIDRMMQADDSDLLFCEVQLFKTMISECETIFNASELLHKRK